MSKIVYTEEDILLHAGNMVNVKLIDKIGFIIIRKKDKQQIGFDLSTRKEIKNIWNTKGEAQTAFHCHTGILYNEQSFYEIKELK